MLKVVIIMKIWHSEIPMEYRNQVVTGDANEQMLRLPNDCIDLTVTSPPYDDMRIYKGDEFDFETFLLMREQLYRITKEGGVVVWVVGDKVINGGESGTSFRQALSFIDAGFILHDTMIYRKAGPAHPASGRYFQVFEYMFVFSKGRPKTFNPIKDRVNTWYGKKWSKERTHRLPNGEMKVTSWDISEGGKLGMRFNVWKYQVGYGHSASDTWAHQHPAIFPEALAADHIWSWSNPGDIVLDPMCGSGTTCKMAKEHGRNFIGFDISEEYIEIAQKRVRYAQPPLF